MISIESFFVRIAVANQQVQRRLERMNLVSVFKSKATGKEPVLTSGAFYV
jgi:hypothetical protein